MSFLLQSLANNYHGIETRGTGQNYLGIFQMPDMICRFLPRLIRVDIQYHTPHMN